LPDYIQHLNGKIINKWISIDPSIVESLPNIIQVERSIAESITKFHIVDTGVVRVMTQVEKDALLAEETQTVINAENQRILDLDLKIDNLPTMTLTRVDTAINNIGNLNDAKVFLKKLCRYIIKHIA
jgi:hypothetical protein